MTAIEIACGACAAQPGEPCTGLVQGFHPEREEAARFVTAVESGGTFYSTEATHQQFEKAVLASGAI